MSVLSLTLWIDRKFAVHHDFLLTVLFLQSRNQGLSSWLGCKITLVKLFTPVWLAELAQA